MENVIEKVKSIFSKVVDFLKKFFSDKKNLVTTLIVLGIIIVVVVVAIIFDKDKNDRFALNEIYNVYPEEVRELYSNIVSVSCSGDLHLDITLDGGVVKADKINEKNLLDYLFSNLDKNNKLTDEFETKIISSTANSLFYTQRDLVSKVDNYQYDGYIYHVDGSKVTRTKDKCSSDRQYVSQLYGYSYDKNQLSMDVNIGYLSNGVLYDLADNRLGEYNNDVKELFNLFVGNSYYRFNYVLDGETYKLDNVEWNSKS